MKVTIATSLGKGHVHIPPSKSMAHRAIICASLAREEVSYPMLPIPKIYVQR